MQADDEPEIVNELVGLFLRDTPKRPNAIRLALG